MKEKAVSRPVRLYLRLACAAAFIASPLAVAQPVLWASSSLEGEHQGSIFQIQPGDEDSILDFIGSTGLVDAGATPRPIPAIAQDPTDGTLYGIAGNRCGGAILITINQTTGEGTEVGPIKQFGEDPDLDYTDDGYYGEGCPGGADALAFGPDGTLYAGAWRDGFYGQNYDSGSGSRLLTLDKTTGEITAFVDVDDGECEEECFELQIAGMAVDPDSGDIWISHGGGQEGNLHIIDPDDGTFTRTLSLNDDEDYEFSSAVISDLAFGTDGTLYASIPRAPDGDCDCTPPGLLVTVDTTDGEPGGDVQVVGTFLTYDGEFNYDNEKISGLDLMTMSTIVQPIDDGECSDPETGGCNPTGLLSTLFPPTAVIGEGATMTQTIHVLHGECSWQTQTFFGDTDYPLVLPPQLCPAREDGEFVVIEVETDGVEFPGGVIEGEMLPENYWDTYLPCDEEVEGDVQEQDIYVWQPKDRHELLEGTAVDLTNGCGSSRGATRRLSYFVVGLKKYFADYDQYPNFVHLKFRQNTAQKIDFLQSSVRNAWFAGSISFREYLRLSVLVGAADRLFSRRHYHAASVILQVFEQAVENRITFEPAADDVNYQGDFLSRVRNIIFQNEAKIIPNA